MGPLRRVRCWLGCRRGGDHDLARGGAGGYGGCDFGGASTVKRGGDAVEGDAGRALSPYPRIVTVSPTTPAVGRVSMNGAWPVEKAKTVP